MHFVLKTDINTLITQLNQTATDLSDSLIVRWIVWIYLFDFDVRHVTERKHTAVNALFKCLYTVSDNVDEEFKKNIDDFLKVKLNVMKIAFIQVRSKSSED